LLFFFVALAGLALDQFTKYLILHHLAYGQRIPMGFFDITHVHNMGAAFGMLQNAGYLFVVIAVVVLAGLFASMHRIREAEPLVVVALALIAGGTVGNLIDRLRFHYVVDFIDLRWWPVFNVADSCICIGVGLLVWKIFRHSHNDPPTEPDHGSAPPI
jgi:signal peptidase II